MAATRSGSDSTRRLTIPYALSLIVAATSLHSNPGRSPAAAWMHGKANEPCEYDALIDSQVILVGALLGCSIFDIWYSRLRLCETLRHWAPAGCVMGASGPVIGRCAPSLSRRIGISAAL